MVEIREETSTDSSGRTQSANAGGGVRGFLKFLNDGGLDSVLWLLRGVTMFCGLMFVFPFGFNKYSAYQKTLLSAATTNALRLHQRAGRVRFDMAFLQTVFAEDSFHYLLYCVTMLSVYPMTLGLATVMLFAFLHWCNFLVHMLQANNLSRTTVCQSVDGFMKRRTQSILHLAACCEIFLFPIIICFALTGKTNIVTPFIYYRFLWVRYASRRNPRTRLAFQEMRVAAENVARHSACPILLSRVIYGTIGLICRLAPTYVPS